MRQHTLGAPRRQPLGNGLGFSLLRRRHLNMWRRSIENRNGSFPVVAISVHIGYLGSQELIGLGPNLMRRPVIDLQSCRPPPHIDPERLPGKRLLKDSLTKIAREEQSIRLRSTHCRQKPQLRNAYVLSLIDHCKIKRRPRRFRNARGQTHENLRIRNQPPRLHLLANPLKNRPKNCALPLREPRLTTQPANVPIRFPRTHLPGVHPLLPFGAEEGQRKLVRTYGLRCLADEFPNDL